MSIEHDVIALGERHAPPNWEPADATARGAISAVPADVGKWALQLDDYSAWRLTDDSPLTWQQIGVVGAASGTDEAIVRMDGATGKKFQNSAITISDTGVISFPDGIRQTFNPDATNAGINVGSIAGDPSSPSNGDVWYDSTANELTARINGATVALGPGGSPGGSAGGVLDGTYPNPGLAASVAGDGLAESSNVLSVNVDNSTIEIDSDSLRVKDAGITAAKLANGAKDGTINVLFDGGGATLTTGVKLDIGPFDFTFTILAVSLLADQTGSIVIDVWKDSYTNYPPTVADTITASAKPTISSAVKSTDSVLTGWSTSVAANDILRFNIDSVTSIQRVTLAFKIRRT